MDREKTDFEERANELLVKELLPLIDDLEAAAKKTKNKKAKKGFELILNKFMAILAKSGLKRIDAVGKKFDPYYHEAVLSEESDKPDGTILEELQKGYMFKSNVIRHSKVKVTKNKQEVIWQKRSRQKKRK